MLMCFFDAVLEALLVLSTDVNITNAKKYRLLLLFKSCCFLSMHLSFLMLT